VKIVKTVTTAQMTIVPALQVRGIALLLFKLAGDEFEPVEDPLDEEVLDVAYGVVGDTEVGIATGADDI
jgi:hypothetical protein